MLAMINDAGVVMDARYQGLFLNQKPIKRKAMRIIASCPSSTPTLKTNQCDKRNHSQVIQIQLKRWQTPNHVTNRIKTLKAVDDFLNF